MDGSYLFQPEVIAASRNFVCARLISYEDKDEAEFLKAVSRTASGELENSSFGMVAPDGKTKLLFAGRVIRSTYADSIAMAEGMNKIMEKFTPKAEISALPLTATVRIGLDVAASDTQPFVLILAADQDKRAALEAELARLAWTPAFVGRFIYASTADAKSLAAIEGLKDGSSVFVIQPDKFGLKGKVLAQTGSIKDIPNTLTSGAKDFVREEKDLRTQITAGRRLGIFWDTKIPVTDPGEAAARDRTKLQ